MVECAECPYCETDVSVEGIFYYCTYTNEQRNCFEVDRTNENKCYYWREG
jgi:hypothetical protein